MIDNDKEKALFQNMTEARKRYLSTRDESIKARKEGRTEDAERLIAQTRELLSPAEDGLGFARSYFDMMQREAAAVLAHRDMLQVMNSLKD